VSAHISQNNAMNSFKQMLKRFTFFSPSDLSVLLLSANISAKFIKQNIDIWQLVMKYDNLINITVA